MLAALLAVPAGIGYPLLLSFAVVSIKRPRGRKFHKETPRS
jgi:hypothetical protein